MKFQYFSKIVMSIVSLSGLFATGLAQECPPASDAVLRVGVLPVLNSLPTYVAAQEGLYERYGLRVELIEVDSGRDRSLAYQAKRIDVGNSDIVADVLQANSSEPVQVIRHDMFTPEYWFFSIVASQDSGIGTHADLIAALQADTAQIAISRNTLIEYLAVEMLEDIGYTPQDNDFVDVAAIPLRLELLAQGKVALALLPEPLTTLATDIQGGTAILSDNVIDFVPVSLSARAEVVRNRPADLCNYLRAYEDAVTLINANPEAYRQNNVRVPDPVRERYTVPTFASFSVPNPANLRTITAWMLARGLIDTVPAYETLVGEPLLNTAQ